MPASSSSEWTLSSELLQHQRWQGHRSCVQSSQHQVVNIQTGPTSALSFAWMFSFWILCLETDKSCPHLSLLTINSYSNRKSTERKDQPSLNSFAPKSKVDEVPLQLIRTLNPSASMFLLQWPHFSPWTATSSLVLPWLQWPGHKLTDA